MLKLAILLSLSWAVFCQAEPLKVGDTFPDLSTFALEGEMPADWKGKILVIDFWASWCAPCAASFPHLDKLQRQFADRGVYFIGVSVDDKASKMHRFLARHPVSFTIVRDASHRLVGACDIPAMPTSFVVDRSGAVRAIHTGFHAGETDQQLIKELEALLK